MSRSNHPIHEGAYFAPFWVNPETGDLEHFDFHRNEEVVLEQILRGGVLADGPGMDIVYFGADGILYYLPKDLTHILAGTTRSYIINYVAPGMGIETQEELVTLQDIRKRRIISAAYVGNAAEFCTLKSIVIADSKTNIVDEIPLEITDTTIEMTTKYAKELRGPATETSGPLQTPVNIQEGLNGRKVLDKVFAAWN
jgi:hypothetical protein